MSQALKNITGKESVGLQVYSGRGSLKQHQTRQLGTNLKETARDPNERWQKFYSARAAGLQNDLDDRTVSISPFVAFSGRSLNQNSSLICNVLNSDHTYSEPLKSPIYVMPCVLLCTSSSQILAIISPDLGRDTRLAPEGFKRSFSGPWPKKVVHH